MNRPLQLAWQRTLRNSGTACAVIEAGAERTCTFRELETAASDWAAHHLATNLVRGHAVVFAAPNSIGWLAMAIALNRAGAVLVPLDPAEPADAQRTTAVSLRAGFWWNGHTLVSLDRPKRFRDPTTCLIKLTSGTTGQPRALEFTDAEMLADGRQVTSTMGIRRSDVNHAVIPFGHSYGLGNLVLPLLAHGVPLVCGSAALPHAIAADLQRWHATVLPAVPALFRALIASDVSRADLARLRLAISAGAPLARDAAIDFEARFGRRIHNFYGSSETGGIAYDRTGEATRDGGVGTAMRGVELKVLRSGRLRVSSAAVFTHGNQHRADRRGAWTPPDIVRLDGRKGITILGRRGQSVKIGARRVNLGEVAARIRALPAVRDVWVGVAGEPEALLGAAVATQATAAELRAALAPQTAAWKIPKRWAVLPEFPLTARGKPDTRALRNHVFGAIK